MKNKVLCYGEMLWDIFPDGAVPGGAPMNVAIGLKKLGSDVFILSSCGKDKLGANLLEYLDENGLSTKYVQQSNYPTGQVNVHLSEMKDASYEIVFPSAWDYIHQIEKLPEFDVLVYGSLSCRNKTSFETLISLLDSGAIKVFDVNFRPPFVDQSIIEQLLNKSDLVKMNLEELFQISAWHGMDSEDLELAADLVFKKYSLKILCITRGSEGAFLKTADKEIYQSGFTVDTKDTVGAGDAFLAGFIHNYSRDKPLKEALEFACLLGAWVASQKGANPPFLFEHIENLKQAF
ncbi:carbohydrate kinase [Daejeonella sp.]|uniref:carbohydrate kinase family protein n=1 Tax=Daejeonella sp. TaxID=2805397 RepID=UPI002731C393|nr:carbohydrate kinase [Daejeonella sp.]MDP2414655.1 carbohydrate kinase [Daejeonella sp.]